MTNKIFEFDPAVYPFRLWVGVDVPSDEITGKFWAYNIVDGTISDIENSDLSGDSVATTYPVCCKEDNAIGAFVHVRRKGRCSVGVMAHEASHVCDFLSDRFGITGNESDMYLHGEARAYFIEWAANCINEVKTGKIRE